MRKLKNLSQESIIEPIVSEWTEYTWGIFFQKNREFNLDTCKTIILKTENYKEEEKKKRAIAEETERVLHWENKKDESTFIVLYLKGKLVWAFLYDKYGKLIEKRDITKNCFTYYQYNKEGHICLVIEYNKSTGEKTFKAVVVNNQEREITFKEYLTIKTDKNLHFEKHEKKGHAKNR